jgi:anti-sigma factor RsiW
MNPNDENLTAYALGELSHAEEQALREQLAANPAAQSELSHIEAISDALHHGAVIPSARLTPQQKQAVLNPVKAPRLMKPMLPRQPMARRQNTWMPVLRGITRFAAAACIAVGAFYLGQNTSVKPAVADASSKGTEKTKTTETSIASMESITTTPEKKVVPVVQAPAALTAQSTPAVIPPPAPVPVVTHTPAVAVAPTPKNNPDPVAKAPASAPVIAASNAGFTHVSKTAASKTVIRPFETRPVPVKAEAGALMASPPSPDQPRTEPQKQDRKTRSPDLLIHSWKAEVATCPWDESRRLVRVLVQLPADQAAATSRENEYPLNVSFDTAQVRGYRLLSEHHARPQAGDATAAHVMWYEVIPARAATESSPRSLAAITLDDVRFVSQTVGPFDSSKLQAMDRGQSWKNARQDFLMESAIVGFKLLMQGQENIGNLDHDLVMQLAKKAAGENPAGEAAKFIRLIEEARKTTGL